MLCPCDSNQPYDDCCKRFHDGAPAPTAELLMRSRYSAYALKLTEYLLKTWHPSKRPKDLDLAKDDTEWLGLEIVDKLKGEAEDSDGVVEFIARCKQQGSEQQLRERSRFVKRSGNWLYKDGK